MVLFGSMSCLGLVVSVTVKGHPLAGPASTHNVCCIVKNHATAGVMSQPWLRSVICWGDLRTVQGRHGRTCARVCLPNGGRAGQQPASHVKGTADPLLPPAQQLAAFWYPLSSMRIDATAKARIDQRRISSPRISRWAPGPAQAAWLCDGRGMRKLPKLCIPYSAV